MFSKIGKTISRVLTPKHGFRATRKKWAPKVAGGIALVGGGMALDKGLDAIQGTNDEYIEYGVDPTNVVDRSWNILRLEDIQNGGKSSL